MVLIFKFSKRKSIFAYGLVEILIALVVIGFLLKGTLGQFMNRFDDAKVKATLALYQKILTATMSFQSRYHYLPGDYPDASAEFGSEVPNGSGTGILNGDGLSAPNTSASSLFWMHLSRAKLFEDGGKISTGIPLNFGKGAPKSDFSNAGFSITHNPEGWGGHWLVLGAASGTSGLYPALTPEQAKLFITQTGQSDPQSGSIRAGNGLGTSNCIQVAGTFGTKKEKACVIYFRLTD